MSILKTIGRLLLAICIILSLVQIILTSVALVTMGNEKPEVLSYLAGRLAGGVLLLALAAVGFKKLGKKN